MKKNIFLLFLFCSSLCFGQNLTSYKISVPKKIYSNSLKDTVTVEITIPKDFTIESTNSYPVIFLLDRQLNINYKYNLHTIDYLTTLNQMPKSIIVGINFPHQNRILWTSTNKTKGKADNFIRFIIEELKSNLKEKYHASNFNLLIGHSRTAIFSSYALSKRPDFFNGIIASSPSYFDFGDNYHKITFESFLDSIPGVPHKYYYYFSTGEKLFGDLHESSVNKLNSYLNSKELPKNLEWKFYKHKITHSLTPGLTVNHSLSEIFKDYGNRLNKCFDIINDPKHAHEVPWGLYSNVYAEISASLGLTINFDSQFFLSIASGYYNDYNGLFKENSKDFAIEILLEANRLSPNNYEYTSWLGELYLEKKNIKKAHNFLDKTINLIEQDKLMSDSEKSELLEEIKKMKN